MFQQNQRVLHGKQLGGRFSRLTSFKEGGGSSRIYVTFAVVQKSQLTTFCCIVQQSVPYRRSFSPCLECVGSFPSRSRRLYSVGGVPLWVKREKRL